MADLNIQRKKAAPSPWWLVALTVLLLATGAWFFLRPGPADDTTPSMPVVAAGSGLTDSLAAAAQATPAEPTPNEAAAADALPATGVAPATPEALAAQAAANPATADYALDGLQMLAATLVDLADRPDLRTAAVQEQRDNLTSATSRLDTPNAPLRAGFVAAAGLLRAMQQQAYPNLEAPVDDLMQLAAGLTGRNATPAEQQQNQQFLTQAAVLVQSISQPAP